MLCPRKDVVSQSALLRIFGSMRIVHAIYLICLLISFEGRISDATQAEILMADSLANIPGIDTFKVGGRTVVSSFDSGTTQEQNELDTAVDNIRREVFGIANREEELLTNATIEKNPDQGASFPGGTAAMDKFIAKHLVYPLTALQNEVVGAVMVRFVVETDGRIAGIVVQKASDMDVMRPQWIY